MTRRNGKPARYINVMKPSRTDDVGLCVAVEKRFLDLMGSYLRIRGVELIPPESLSNDMFRWRTMAVRFKQGDFRNTEAELKSLKTIAQWTISINCELRNQADKIVEWKE